MRALVSEPAVKPMVAVPVAIGPLERVCHVAVNAESCTPETKVAGLASEPVIVEVTVPVAVAPDQRPAGVVFRPAAIWNPNTNTTVLWLNWVAANGTYMGYAAFTSQAPDGGPEGPFALQRSVSQENCQSSTTFTSAAVCGGSGLRLRLVRRRC